jgi:hypothetical protein
VISTRTDVVGALIDFMNGRNSDMSWCCPLWKWAALESPTASLLPGLARQHLLEDIKGSGGHHRGGIKAIRLLRHIARCQLQEELASIDPGSGLGAE